MIAINSSTPTIHHIGTDYGYPPVKRGGTQNLKNSEAQAQIDGELETKVKNQDIFRIKWTGNPRIIDAGQSDPYDPRFILHGGSERVRVNGDGTLSPVNSVSSDSYPNSPRLYVKGPWKNTEITIWAKASSFDYLQLRGRNDHNTNCGFGGYLVIFRSSGSTAIAKEITHPLYTKKIAGDHFAFAEDKWIGYRARFIDSTIEGFVNTGGSWKKVISAIDTGKWSYQNEAQVAKAEVKCGSISNEPFTREQPYNFVRINNGVDVFFKLYSIRKI
jgi:hypothetical protein